ncbi:MAG: MFS transporter [Acidobacteriia bacterium 12-62-4]|nr:MAG: MFS transporter [Acidobacteriia bacterium 12-62-4]
MIKVEGISKRYPGHTAVDNISFEVEKGQIVGFLGPNGAGKTTTMRILTCFMPPTSGTANVAGYDVLENPLEVKRRIGYLPETPPLYPEMEVAEYLTFVGKLKGLSGDNLKKRVAEVSEKCNVADVSQKLVSKLSKGYKQRVGLAQAIIHNPDVLILDEPTSGLDPKQIHETRDLIKGLAGEHTIILSTHILPEVEQICERVVIISRGKLVATDTMESLKNRMHGSAVIGVTVETPSESGLVQEKLERVAGVSRVILKETLEGGFAFEVESLQGRRVQADLARAVVEAGWNLTELRPVSLSLEEVFLQLTATEASA